MDNCPSIFRAHPLYKLCEFEGKPLPPDHKSDCYKDADETDFACKEKYRIMVNISQQIHENLVFIYLCLTTKIHIVT